jgi:hypothetical protein
MEVFPGNTLRIENPVLVAARIAAGGFALIEQGHVRGLSPLCKFNKLSRIVRLEAEVVHTGLRAAR